MDGKENSDDLQCRIADGDILPERVGNEHDDCDLHRQKKDHEHDPQRRRNAALALLPYLHSFHFLLFLPGRSGILSCWSGAEVPRQFFSFRRRVLMSYSFCERST